MAAYRVAASDLPSSDTGRALLALMDDAQAQALRDWLAPGDAPAFSVTTDPGAFSAALDGSEGKVLVICPAPDEALALRLQQGIPADRALADWQAEAERLRGLLRRNRRRIGLVVFDSLRAGAQASLALCAVPLARAEAAAFPIGAPDPLLRLLGAELLRRDPAARSLAAEIEASASSILNAPVQPDLEAIRRARAEAGTQAEEYRAQLDAAAQEMQDLRAAQSDLDTARAVIDGLQAAARQTETRLAVLAREHVEGREERDAVLRQLLQTQESLSLKEREAAALEARLVQLRGGMESGEALRSELEGRLTETERRLAQRDSDVARLTQADKTARAKIEKLRKDVAKRDARIARMMSSVSMRITRPLRWLRSLFGGRQA